MDEIVIVVDGTERHYKVPSSVSDAIGTILDLGSEEAVLHASRAARTYAGYVREFESKLSEALTTICKEV